MTPDPMEEIRQTFFIECGELLESMESGLLAIQGGDDDAETVNAVFRAAHSIKGGAGAFGFDDLVRFAHKFESVLEDVRSHRLEVTRPVIETMLRASDMLGDLVRAAEVDGGVDRSIYDALIAEFDALAGNSGEEAADEEEDAGFQPLPLSFDNDFLSQFDDEAGDAEEVHTVVFRPAAALFKNGGEPALLLRELEALGAAEAILDCTAVPPLEDLDPLEGYCSWTVEVKGADEQSIREAFEFVDTDCELEITKHAPLSGESDFEAQPLEDAPAEDTLNVAPPLAEIEAVEPPPASAPEQAEPAGAPEAGPRSVSNARRNSNATIRVDLDKMDRLINLVGELVVNQAMLSQSVMDAGLAAGSSVASGLDEFKQLTREVQDSVMAIRAQPVKSLFQRMSRIVREAAAATGKDVRLDIEGESTEVDKTVIDQLSDPLTHMLRNAVDHGLESPEARLEKGKPAQGRVLLSAAHRSGRVVIELSDDGAGINRDRVRQIAIEKGLVSPDASLTPGEIDNIIFMPGFSTAKDVSDLSGRGVGMDVVKRSIQALSGKISIRSNPGEGSTFTISLPLTLAVVEGLVVEIEQETLVIPITFIVETIKPMTSHLHKLGNEGQVIFIRGEFIPVVDVGARLGLRPPLASFMDRVLILVDLESVGLRAFVVDAIRDQRQVVIKSLEQNYQPVDGIAAATILGDGRIALILDPEILGAEQEAPADWEQEEKLLLEL